MPILGYLSVKKMGTKKYRVTLTEQEREFLRELIRSGKHKKTKLVRAQILLGADESEGGKKMSDEEIALAYDVNLRTIGRRRKCFVEHGFEICLNGVPRPVNREKILDGRVESHLVALRCSDPPSGYNRWTLRLLANKMVELGHVSSISHESVNTILKKTRSSRGLSNLG